MYPEASTWLFSAAVWQIPWGLPGVHNLNCKLLRYNRLLLYRVVVMLINVVEETMIDILQLRSTFYTYVICLTLTWIVWKCECQSIDLVQWELHLPLQFLSMHTHYLFRLLKLHGHLLSLSYARCSGSQVISLVELVLSCGVGPENEVSY